MIHVNTIFIFQENWLITSEYMYYFYLLSCIRSTWKVCNSVYGGEGLQKKIQEHYITFVKRLNTFLAKTLRSKMSECFPK